MKKYIGWIAVVLVLLIGGTIFAVREITYAQYVGAEEAAQTVLDKTPLSKVAEVEPYTGGMNGFFFRGPDELGRELYVWTQKGKVVATAYADQGMSREEAIQAAQKPVWAEKLVRESMHQRKLLKAVEVVHAYPGPILPNSKAQFRTAPSKFVWEIYGKLEDGNYGYTYVDFIHGQVVWQIALPDPEDQEEEVK
ncbi:MAG TPA: hypothetical protein VFV52_18610 [Bacilli bacterium]|nr:hypothetical protein [Bacilli bacterium]